MTIINRDHSFKIVIVSEDIRFRDILASKLRLDNFEVEFASGGFHLLYILERQKEAVNMIIFNGNMSDMPANEMIALSRQGRSKTDLPMLFVSKSNTEAEIYELIHNGANEYIVQTANFKPIIERAHKYLYQIKTNVA